MVTATKYSAVAPWEPSATYSALSAGMATGCKVELACVLLLLLLCVSRPDGHWP